MTLTPITSDALHPLKHGFFTREGGASSGIFSGLNCGFGSSDQSGAVAVNRNRVAEKLGVRNDALLLVNQVHSANVVVVGADKHDFDIKADAMVTRQPGLALAVLTADCQPVLLADTKNGVIGAAHAGWKGALYGILEATVDAMEGLGADRANIHAAIGPSISLAAYEVGAEFLETFVDEDSRSTPFFANGEVGKYQFDLPGYGLFRLRHAGVGLAEWTGHCTYRDPKRFFSYRRSTHAKEADYGRLISTIRL